MAEESDRKGGREQCKNWRGAKRWRKGAERYRKGVVHIPEGSRADGDGEV